MADTVIRWEKIADSLDELRFGEGNLIECIASGKKICISRHEDKLRAFSPVCPHAGARLVYSKQDEAGNIICPLHKYKFNPANGLNISGEGYHLKTYVVERREDGVYIGIR